MSLSTCAVTCISYDQAGAPIAGTIFQFELSHADVNAGYVLPERVTATADADGIAVVDLWPNAAGTSATYYKVTITKPGGGRREELTAYIPDITAANLHDVASMPDYEGKPDGAVVVEAAVTAGQTALGAANSAISARDAAQESETAAAASEVAAAASEAAALASETAASASETAAAASQAAAATSAATASTAATTATTKASEASASATAAAASETAAASSETAAAASEAAAAASETAAASSETAAAGSASSASTSAATATTKASEAAASAAAAALYDPDSFVKRFASGAALPGSDIGPIWHDDYAAVMTWRTIGAYTGYASLNVGQISYFEATSAPTGWLKSQGQTLTSAYAALNAYRGSTTLKDLRAEFLRGLDDGRGIDTGRVLGSAQADGIKTSSFSVRAVSTNSAITATSGEFSHVAGSGTASYGSSLTSGTASSAVVTLGSANETHPRNVAMLACIKF